MAITINGETKRSAAEQIRKNQLDIAELQESILTPSFENITGQPTDNEALASDLNTKVDKVSGKGLSTNDFTTPLKTKLEGIDMSSKQDLLTTDQLAAVNSGVTQTTFDNVVSVANGVFDKEWKLESDTPLTLTIVRDDTTKKTHLAVVGGSGVWGSISGNIELQTDLINKLSQYVTQVGLEANYRTKEDQNTIDQNLSNAIVNEKERAEGVEEDLQDDIDTRLKPSNIIGGSHINVTISGKNVTIDCGLSAMTYKNTVTNLSDLPATAQPGDVYGVTAVSALYVKTADGWDHIGAIISADNFYTKGQADDKFATKTSVYTKTEADTLFPTKTNTYTKSEVNANFIKNTGQQAIQGSIGVGNTSGICYLDNTGIATTHVEDEVNTAIKISHTGIERTITEGGAAISNNYSYPDIGGKIALQSEVTAEANAREQADNTKQDKITETNKLPYNLIYDTPTTLSGYGITDAYTKSEADDKYALQTTLANYLPLAGGALSGDLSVGNNLAITGSTTGTTATFTGQVKSNNRNVLDTNDIINNLTSTSTSDALSANQGKVLNDKFGNYLAKAGGTMTGAINMGSKKITSLATPTANTDATTKAYVDGLVAFSTGTPTTGTSISNSASFWIQINKIVIVSIKAKATANRSSGSTLLSGLPAAAVEAGGTIVSDAGGKRIVIGAGNNNITLDSSSLASGDWFNGVIAYYTN